MAKNTQRKPQPIPSPQVTHPATDGATVEQVIPENNQAPATVGGMNTMLERASSWLDDTPQSERLAKKHEIMSRVKQRLAEAADKDREVREGDAEVSELAVMSAYDLYVGMKDRLFSPDEVTALLGDSYGFKLKGTDGDKTKPYRPGDSAASKTPFGTGEIIRKRVFRAAKANDYVTDGDGGTFFENLPEEKVEEIVDAIGTGDDKLSIWTAYDRFQKLKSSTTERTEFAFDPKKVAGLNESLLKQGAFGTIGQSGELVAAYKSLLRTMLNMAEALAPKPTE